MHMNQSIVYALPLVAAFIVGCSTQPPENTRNDDGSITVHCNKSSLRWNACYQTAATLCMGKGYQIVSEDSSEMPIVTTNANEVPVIGGAMRIRCNQ